MGKKKSVKKKTLIEQAFEFLNRPISQFAASVGFARAVNGLKAFKIIAGDVSLEDLNNDLDWVDCRVDSDGSHAYIVDDNAGKVYTITWLGENKLDTLNEQGAVMFPVAKDLKPSDFPLD